MKNLYLFIIAVALTSVCFGQTVITSQTFLGTTIPAGWSQNNVSFSASGALFFSPSSSTLTSPSFAASAYSSFVLNFQIAKVGSGANDTPITVLYSTNGGASFITGGTSQLVDSETFVPVTININNPGANAIIFRFAKLNGARDIRFRNLVITGNCIAPANPQAFAATAVSSSQINLSYTANAANNNTVIVFNTTNTFSAPTGTPPAVGSSFAGGTLLFNAPGNGTYNHTGLNPVTTYYYRAFSYNNCNYSTGLSAQATTPCATTLNPQAFTATAVSSSQINLGYTANAANNNTIIVFNTTNTFGTPSGTPPAVGGTFTGGGTVLFNGSGNGTFNHSGLNQATTYYYRAYSYNGCSYSTGQSAQATTPCATTLNPQAFTATAVSPSQINLGYTANAANNNTVIVFNTTNTFSTPTGTPPAVGSAFGGGTLLFVAAGNGTFNHTGLNPSTIYYYRAYSYNGCSYSSGLNAQATTAACEPSAQATNFNVTNINSPSVGNASLNWTRGSGSNVLVVMRQGSPVSSNPVDGSTYTANTEFGLGQQIGEGNYVVYNGTASAVAVTGLNVSFTYHVAVYEFNSTGNCYKTPGLLGSFTFPTPVTYLYANGWLPPGDPNGISTAADNISILVGNVIIDTNTLINNVDVNAFSALIINSGITLQVNGILKMESSNLNYSSLMVEGSVIGDIRYNRHVNGGPGTGVGIGANDLISSPLVSSQNFGAFATSNPNIRFDTRPAPLGDPNNKVFGPFDKATGAYLVWNSVTDAAEALVPGVGYRAASTDNGGFLFRGTVNQGIVTNNITYTTTPGVPFRSWNLVGNPYPAYINVGDFLSYLVYDDADPALDIRNVDLLTNASGAIYGYDGNANDGWTIWNLNTPDKNMTPGQGFLVSASQAQVAAHDLTFAPSMRRIGNTDDFIPGRSANTNNSHLRLRAMIGSGNYHTDFYFNDNSSSGLDRGYDAAVYGDVAGSTSIYSRLVENNAGIDMAIQSLATTALGSDIIVPLGIKAAQGQQVTVSITESDLPSNIEVYLEDNVTGVFTLLNNSDYTFTPSSTLTSTGRFFLRFSDQTLSTLENEINGLQIYTTATPRILFVKGQLAETTSIIIYDIQGRVVLSKQLEASSSSNQLDVSTLSDGVYVVKLNNTKQQKTQKVIIR